MSWRADPRRLLPDNPSLYAGPRLPFWGVCIVLTLVTARSCVHVFKADGGAQSIASIDVQVAGGVNIVAIFGQWGAIQLLLAGLLWLLVLRWRGMIPLVICTLMTEPFLRSLAGHLKPVVAAHTPPGAALNWVLLPALLGMLYMSLCPVAAQQDRRISPQTPR